MNSSIVKWILPFVLGIILEGAYPTKHEIIPLIICTVMVVVVPVCVRMSYRYKVAQHIYLMLFIAIAVLFGYTISLLHSPLRYKSHYTYAMPSSDMYEVMINEKPSHTAKSIKATASMLMIHTPDGWKKTKGKAILYFQKDSLAETLQYGDKIVVQSKLRNVEPPNNPYEFDYSDYLAKRYIYATAYIQSGHYTIVEKSSQKGILAFAYKLRDMMMGIINNSSLSEQEKSIASAMLLGWDENIDIETLQKFSNAGISHILCVSGLHLGIISILVSYCLFFLSNSKKHRIIKGCIRILVLWFFVMITGMAPSAMRAATMFTLIVIGEMFFERADIFSNVATSAFILLLINPNYIYDVGFQLSYSAVIGIVALKPFLDNFLTIPTPKDWEKWYYNKYGSTSIASKFLIYSWQKICNTSHFIASKILSFAYISFSAQLFTAPFILYYFHQFPVYFLVANVAIIPFSGILLATAILVVISAGKAFTGLFSIEIKGINYILDWVSKLPSANLSDIYFDTPMFCLSLLAILCLMLAIVRRWKPYLFISIGAMIVLAGYAITISWTSVQQSKWIVYESGNDFAMEMFDGNTSYFVADSYLIDNKKEVKYFAGNYRINNCTEKINNIYLDSNYVSDKVFKRNSFIAFYDCKIAVINKNNYKQHSNQKLHLTHIILTNNPYISVCELRQQFDFDTIIIASNNYRTLSDKWACECDSLGIPYHDVHTQGAYVANIAK